jgi:diacylglycerol diphosphate phosphatase/phosphatidate phosphatase
MSHRPYSPRVPRDEPVLPTTAQDRHSVEGEQVDLMDGGVLRPDPTPLEDIWREGESERNNVESA